ncbi:MAG: ABC transporter ATP-binding protein [Candidatus Sumerlaeota bacterium]|nr:ABC transporter ATP-binding protein [Candidatus Sumerlaeota bacterium]
MLEVDGIDVFYGDAQVLWDVGFEVRPGELFVLVGANGAGKSTALKAISSLIRPARGRIQFEGEALHALEPHQVVERGVVHVPEGRRLFPEMTVEENLLLGAMTRRAKAKRRSSLEWVYELFPRLQARRRQPAGTLSGGEQQMAAVGRGLMGQPRLLMVDEPSLGLAPILVGEIFSIVRRVHEEGVTTLMIEQNVQQSLAVCDRACVLENGRIVLHGSGQQLLHNDQVRAAYLGL